MKNYFEFTTFSNYGWGTSKSKYEMKKKNNQLMFLFDFELPILEVPNS